LNNLISTLAKLKPERMVSRKEEKRATYLVDDSTSIRMTAYDRDAEEIVNWYVGKESQGMTYIRAADENEIYAIGGSLRSPLDKDFDSWRDKTFLRVSTSDIHAITFKYPSDSGFVLRNNSGKWMIDDRPADSAMVQQYVNKLRSRNLNDFAKVPPSSAPDVTVTIDGGKPATIKAWKGADEQWTLTSSIQPGVYFTDSRLPRDLFVGKTTFLPR
jgi:hypothetical protein